MSHPGATLTSMVKSSGCAAKLDPTTLHQVLSTLPPFPQDNRLLVGNETSDDALAYQISDTIAILQTVDFFPPMVDDPYTFGQVAAANALSDIYAMGGTPAVALNLVCFPACLDTEVLSAILAGGASKAMEAGIVIAGGHTISDAVPKYGLCVTGMVHPQAIWRNGGVRPGDVLVLTKPLGIGIINTAVKGELASAESAASAIHWMTLLNKQAQEAAHGLAVHACTDVTGFGLLGHALEMATASDVQLVFDSGHIPLIGDVREYASMGLIPQGMYTNMEYVGGHVSFATDVAQDLRDILFDPQTSGGLLLAMDSTDAQEYLRRLPTAHCIAHAVVHDGKSPHLVVE